MLNRVSLLLFLYALTWPAVSKEACPQGKPQLIIYHAGSLSTAFKAVADLYTKQSGVCVEDVAGGSVSLARKLSAGKQAGDLYAGADDQVIEQLLKPAGYADYSIRFAAGAMVLAYTSNSRHAGTIAAAGSNFSPPQAIPAAAADWYLQLTRPGVSFSGSHPFLDPGAYRADMIFQLAQAHYGVANLYDDLLSHYVISRDHGGLGSAFDYQFTYEHSALAAYKADKTGTYRYLRLPDEINLGAPALDSFYAKHAITLPGLQSPGAAATARIPASRVTWGITLMNDAPNREHALAFLQLLFSPEGTAILNEFGPAALNPPRVSEQDFARLPAALKALVQLR